MTGYAATGDVTRGYRCVKCRYRFACHAFRPDCPQCGAGTRDSPAVEAVEP